MRLGGSGDPRLERERTETRKERFANTLRRAIPFGDESVDPAQAGARAKVAPTSEDTGRNFSAAQAIFQRVVRFLPLPGINPEWETVHLATDLGVYRTGRQRLDLSGRTWIGSFPARLNVINDLMLN